MMLEKGNKYCFLTVDEVKQDKLAVAVLMDLAYHKMRLSSEILVDLNLPSNEPDILIALENGDFIKPNPHRDVPDINYVLSQKGYFLVNELKSTNPDLFRDIEPEFPK